MQINVASIVFITIFAVLTPELRAQTDGLQLPELTHGATHESQSSRVPGLTEGTSQCRVSDDPTYGVTPGNPVKVGGGVLYLAARSLRFLNALRGPTGEGLHFKRLGSFEHTDGALLDVYLVEHDGIARHIYVDGYRWAEPKAPRGWLCGAAMALDPPRPDPFETQRQLITLAARLDPTSAGPISLDPDGSATHGVVFDHVRLVGRAFAAAAASGQPFEMEKLPREITTPHFVVVAFPVKCDGERSVAPQTVKVSDVNGNSPRVVKEARGDKIQELVPGFTVPTTALAISYDANLAIPGKVEISYAEACDTTPRTVTLPVTGQAGRITRRVAGRLPTGITLPPGGAQVAVQVFFDFDGKPHFPAYAGGLGTLADAAIAAAADFQADPPRVNGAPLLQVSTIAVAFEPETRSVRQP